MQTGNNNIDQDRDIRNVILNSLINFKTLSRQLRKSGRNGNQLSNLALYTLLLLKNNSSLLRNDIMKKFHVNYYDAGSAIDSLIMNGMIKMDVSLENSNIKTLLISRKRYRLTLNGDIYVSELLKSLED